MTHNLNRKLPARLSSLTKNLCKSMKSDELDQGKQTVTLLR